MKEWRYSSDSTALICKVSEDNKRALELARFPKMYPHTKHINEMYYYFRSYVSNSNIKIYPIDTSAQIEDIFTKLLSKDHFYKFCFKLIGF